MAMKPAGKFVVIVLIVGGLLFGLKYFFGDKLIPKGNSSSVVNSDVKLPKNTPIIKILCVTWGGNAGGQWFNRGFEPTTASMFYKDYGFGVKFVVNDDFESSRNMWKAGDVDLLWITADAFTTEVNSLAQYEPKIVFQTDWSRGGDAIVVTRDINTIEDLRGKKIAVAYGTPSHTFLLWMLQAGDLSYNSVDVVEVASAVEAASYFKAGKVEAAVVWSPDDEDCVTKVTGAKVLKSTKEAEYIIADVFYAKKTWIDSHQKELTQLIEGWMKGATDINTNPDSKAKAAKILASGFNIPDDFAMKAINNVRLCTYGDNENFFGLNPEYKGVKGEDIYSKSGRMFQEIGLAKDIPQWRNITDLRAFRSINPMRGVGDEAEPVRDFVKITNTEGKKAVAYATKRLSVTFPTNSSELSSAAKTLIDSKFVDIAKNFSNSRIRIEGNTDIVGDYNKNVELSKRRAQAVVDYLVNQYGFDNDRFVVVGNGPDKPIADNNTPEGRANNRRTDFELLK